MNINARLMLGCILVLAVFSPRTHTAVAGGVPAGPNTQITDPALKSESASNAALAMQGNTLYSVWMDERFTASSIHSEVFFAKSVDGGQTWSANKDISSDTYDGYAGGYIYNTTLSVSPNNEIYAAWGLESCLNYGSATNCNGQEFVNDVRLARSTDGGATFKEYTVYDGKDNAGDPRPSPHIHADDDRVYVLFGDANASASGFDLYVRIITPTAAGLNGATPTKISEGSGNGRDSGVSSFHGSVESTLAVQGNTVCAAWEDIRGGGVTGRFSIYGTCSTNRGQTFSPNVQLAGNDDYNPQLAFGPDGRLYLAYQDEAGRDIYVRISSDNGATWGVAKRVMQLDSSLKILSFDLKIDPNGQIVIATPLRSGSGYFSESDLFLFTSIDNGVNFTSFGPVQDGQGKYPTIATQFQPQMVIKGNTESARAYIVWSDDRNTNAQIWLGRVDLDSALPSAPTNLTATNGDTSVLLQWAPSTDSSGIAGYHVFRAASSGGAFTQLTSRLNTQTYYRDVGLAGGTYVYKIIALDGTGNASTPSNEASGTANAGSGFGGLNGSIYYDNNDDAIAARDLPANANDRVITQGFAANPSADGARLYYLNNNTVFVRDLSNGTPQTLYSYNSGLSNLDVSADGSTFAAVHQETSASVNGACFNYEPRVRTFNPTVQLYDAGSENHTSLALSDDKVWLASLYASFCTFNTTGFFRPYKLCLANVVTKKTTCTQDANIADPDFAPNSHWLVFAADYSGQLEVWKAFVNDNGALSQFTQLTRGVANQPVSAPSWSSDGNWIVFARDTDSNPGDVTSQQLYVVRADGDGLRALGGASLKDPYPAWVGGGAGAPPIHPTGSPRAFLPVVSK